MNLTVEQIETWLGSLGVTLWGTFDLSQPERKRQAAEWLKEQMDAVQQFNNLYPIYGDNFHEPVSQLPSPAPMAMLGWDVVG